MQPLQRERAAEGFRGKPHLIPGVSWGGWSVISLFTCSLEHRMMDRRSFRAVLNVMEPPMAFRVLDMTKKKKQQSERVVGIGNVLFRRVFARYAHFGDGIPDPAKLGQFIDAFLLDDGAVHVETHSFGSPEKFLRLREGCHRAAKAEWHGAKDAQAATHTGPL